jgi:hypothetical protein
LLRLFVKDEGKFDERADELFIVVVKIFELCFDEDDEYERGKPGDELRIREERLFPPL